MDVGSAGKTMCVGRDTQIWYGFWDGLWIWIRSSCHLVQHEIYNMTS